MVSKEGLTFPAPTRSSGSEGFSAGSKATFIRAFDASRDPEGVRTHVPHMNHFYDNSLQTGLMRDMAMDLEMGEHLVLLGNQVCPRIPDEQDDTEGSAQGVGKNKIIDRYVQAYTSSIYSY